MIISLFCILFMPTLSQFKTVRRNTNNYMSCFRFQDCINDKQICRSSMAVKGDGDQDFPMVPMVVCQKYEDRNENTPKKTPRTKMPLTPKIGKENIQYVNQHMTPKSNLLCTPTRLTRSALKLTHDGFATPRAPLSAAKTNLQRQNTESRITLKTTPNNVSRSKSHTHLVRVKNLPPLL